MTFYTRRVVTAYQTGTRGYETRYSTIHSIQRR